MGLQRGRGRQEEHGRRVLSVDDQVQVPAGHYRSALLTRDLNPLEPTKQEYKLYAKGVGPVLELLTSGGSGRAELRSYTPGK